MFSSRRHGVVVPALGAATAYFAAAMAAGVILGTVRVLWVEPRLGTRVAEILELPLLLALCALASRRIVRSFALPARGPTRALVGLGALSMLLACELTLVLGWRGIELDDYVASRDPVAAAAYLAALGVFAALPVWVGR